jgi:hypothetical protein
MQQPPPRDLPPETEDTGLEGMLAWHLRSRWFQAKQRYMEAYEDRMRSIDTLLPASSQGILSPVCSAMAARNQSVLSSTKFNP